MSKLVRLEGYRPVEIAGGMGFCQHLGVQGFQVDLPPALRLQVGETLPFRLLCTDRLSVAGSARVEGAVEGALAPLQRFALCILSLDGEDKEALVGHLSSLRKTSHLRIAASEDVESDACSAGWDRWRLPHDSMPELSPEDLDLSTSFLGKELAAPLVIAGMTGGSEWSGEINRRLASVAQELGLALGLGSQRAMLETPSLSPTYRVRDLAPDILLLGNVGAVQLLRGVSVDDCKRLVDAVEADALAIHLNPLQEMVQPEGDRDWRGVRTRLAEVIPAMHVPVLLKETGAGMSPDTAQLARDLGAQGIDVGGTGGTAWGFIEGFRSADGQRQAIGQTFRNWGWPTAESVRRCREALGAHFPIVATGGVRSGVDAALAIALGANLAGLALPFFRAADASEEDAMALGRRIVEELRIAMVCSGAASLEVLRALEPVEWPTAPEGEKR